ncbi:PTS sugar transporter subunit IIA [Xylocopilactobacillus apicola]|uniref:PTS fructose transporter subunit IIA n=1 Tax=Xylocopilactobacillus apicola TaxID=2932184 RepID=A0AAU9D626_9LACO|nr:PTS sugar transporter subunit IIA [Xylocopilactobacillus apicola]BDR58978.1 PTS fructose transporter subunit IIA [Xylocopilactobacillus apicola]
MQLFLVSHGQLAKGMKNSIEMISGKHDNLQDFSMSETDSPEIIRQRVEKAIEEHSGEEIILISDFPGGSINTCLTKLINERVFLISGMNIMMILELVLEQTNKNIQELIESGIRSAKNSIVLVKLNKEETHNNDIGDDFFD